MTDEHEARRAAAGGRHAEAAHRGERSSVGHVRPVDPAGARQLLALIGGPAAVLVSMQVKYILVPWACASGTVLALHAVAAAGVLAALVCGRLARREWSSAGGGWPDDEGGARGRSRFLGLLAMLMSAVSAIVMLAQWIPEFFLSPCHH